MILIGVLTNCLLSVLQYLPLPEFANITNALNFDTTECRVQGSCDLYTIKAASGDKKLYKAIESSLESQYASLLRFSAGLSSAEAASAAGSLNLSRASPFGSLGQSSSRKTYKYLIATLNASHPDYDFSHLLRPSDFRREKSLKQVMNTLNTTLYNLQPRHTSNPAHDSAASWPARVRYPLPPASPGNEIWSPQMWQVIDKEMKLEDCSIYCYLPEEDPYDGEEGAIWSFNYFFFNRKRKRVCYIYLRGLSIISHVPTTPKTPFKTERDAESDWLAEEQTSSKRARYWLGDHADNATSAWAEDDEDIGKRDGEWSSDPFLDSDKEPRTIADNGEQLFLSSGEITSPSAFDASSPEPTIRSRSKSRVNDNNDNSVNSPVV